MPLWLLSELHKKQGMTMLMVTHEPELAKTADRVIRMQDGEVLA
jgi:putative ABC transport system ATP-binding protein